MRVVLPGLLLATMTTAACDSPEAKRTRGGGPGADQGNRPAAVKMHEGSDQFWRTPDRISLQHPPLAPAQHAREVESGRDDGSRR